MKKIIELTLILLFIINMNQLNAYNPNPDCDNSYEYELVNPSLSGGYSCTTNYYLTVKDNFVYFKSYNYDNINYKIYKVMHYNPNIILYETKYGNHLFYGVEESFNKNNISFHIDGVKIFENKFEENYFEEYKEYPYDTFKNYLIKNNFSFYYYRLADDFFSLYELNKESKKIELGENHLKQLNIFLEKLFKLDEKKYNEVIEKLENLYNEYESKKKYREKYIFEALHYLSSEIKIMELKK